MLRRFAALALCLAAAVPFGCSGKNEPTGGGEEPRIKYRNLPAGSTVNCRLSVDLTVSTATEGDPKAAPPRTRVIRAEIGYTLTVVEFPDGAQAPTKYRVQIDRWELSPDTFSILGDPGKPEPVLGRTYLITVPPPGGGGAQLRAEDGGNIDPRVEYFLLSDCGGNLYWWYYKNFMIESARGVAGIPLRPGHTWAAIPDRWFAQSLGPDGVWVSRSGDKRSTGKAAGKLIDVSTRGNRQYAQIELTATFTPNPEPSVTYDDGSKTEFAVALDACVDGSVYDIKHTVRVNSDIRNTFESGPVRTKNTEKVSGSVTRTETEQHGPPPAK